MHKLSLQEEKEVAAFIRERIAELLGMCSTPQKTKDSLWYIEAQLSQLYAQVDNLWRMEMISTNAHNLLLNIIRRKIASIYCDLGLGPKTKKHSFS